MPDSLQSPYLALDRFARAVCDAELSELISSSRHYDVVSNFRREIHRKEGDELFGNANGFAKRNGIPFGVHDNLLRALSAKIMAVMNQMGRTWWPECPEEVNLATPDLRQRMENCREASLLLLRFADYHGFSVPKVHPGDKTVPPTWDEVFDKLSAWEERLQSQAIRVADNPGGQAVATPAVNQTKPASKRSSQRGDGKAKLIAALTKHHKYADGSCLNLEPIGNNELANEAGVSNSTASVFFNKSFDGYTKYRVVCRDPDRLVDSLKALNGEFSPHELYGRRPPNEDDRDDKGEK